MSVVTIYPTRTRSANLPTGITTKMQCFAEAVAEGLSAADAYRTAFNTSRMLPKTIRDEASRLLKNPGVTAAIEASRAEKRHLRCIKVQTAEERIWEQLWAVIEGEAVPPSAKLKALALAAELAGMMGNSNPNPEPSVRQIEQELATRLSYYI